MTLTSLTWPSLSRRTRLITELLRHAEPDCDILGHDITADHMLTGGSFRKTPLGWHWFGYLQWVWQQISTSSGLGDPTLHFPQWQDILVHHGVYWKKLIGRGIQHACLQRKKNNHASELHERIGTLLLNGRLVDELPSQAVCARPDEEGHGYGCMQCLKKIAPFAGESVHMCKCKLHGILAQEVPFWRNTLSLLFTWVPCTFQGTCTFAALNKMQGDPPRQTVCSVRLHQVLAPTEIVSSLMQIKRTALATSGS